MRWTRLAAAAVLASMTIAARAAEPGVTGLWLTDDRLGAVEIKACGDSLCGQIYWMKPPESALLVLKTPSGC